MATPAVADEKYFYHISYILSSFLRCSLAHKGYPEGASKVFKSRYFGLSGTFLNFCVLSPKPTLFFANLCRFTGKWYSKWYLKNIISYSS